MARTLADCASVLDRSSLIELVDTALCEGKTSVDAIKATLERTTVRRERTGTHLLREVLAAWAGPIEPDSPAEIRLLRMLGEWGYPTPERQVEVRENARRVIAHPDAGWPARRIGIEYDSVRFHNPRAWVRDETRHNRVVDVAHWRLMNADKGDLLPVERSLRDALAREWSARAA